MGPLKGIKVIEISGIGPGPFCGMMLSDMGAEVTRVDRLTKIPGRDRTKDVLVRGRKSMAIDLKSPEGVATVLRMVEQADAIFEGFRPGVVERLGIGPEQCLARNPKIVYGRMTGWGQDGPMSMGAGHDINYIALSGALYGIGRKGEPPVPPLNLVGDFGGGGMMLAFGIVCGILEARQSGKGQVIDTAMSEGSAALMAMFSNGKEAGLVYGDDGENMLDGSAPFYDSYETKDGKYICIGSIEPQFYDLLVVKAELDKERFYPQMDYAKWPERKEILTKVFKGKTQAEWCALMEGSDVCFSPVLPIAEAPNHPHNKARKAFIEVDGVVQPAPTPRFSRTVPGTPSGISSPGQNTNEVLADWGFTEKEIATLNANGVVEHRG